MLPTLTTTGLLERCSSCCHGRLYPEKETQRNKPASLDQWFHHEPHQQKKNSVRKKLKQRESSVLREKFRSLRSEIKRRLYEWREVFFFVDMESNFLVKPETLLIGSESEINTQKGPWNDYHGNQWQLKYQGLHSKRSGGIIQPLFCVGIRVWSGNSSPWKVE